MAIDLPLPLNHSFAKISSIILMVTNVLTVALTVQYERNPGHFGPCSFRPGSFRPIFRVGHFGLGRWVVSAHFRGESFRP